MIAKTVEELIYALESFDGEFPLSIGERNGKSCIMIHQGMEGTRVIDRIYLPMV